MIKLTRKDIIKKISDKLGINFEVSEAWDDSQEGENVSYVVVRIDYFGKENKDIKIAKKGGEI